MLWWWAGKSMGAKEARQHDDFRHDPDNPIVPYRLSDRIEAYKTRWMVLGLYALLGFLGSMPFWMNRL